MKSYIGLNNNLYNFSLNSNLTVSSVVYGKTENSECILYRQGKRRMLNLNRIPSPTINLILTLNSEDAPTNIVIAQALMAYRTSADAPSETYYSAYITVGVDGEVRAAWYSPGTSAGNNIGGLQYIYGQIEWYVN